MGKITSRFASLYTFLLVTLGLAYACVEGSYTWRGRFDLQLFGLVVFGGGLLGWLAWRGFGKGAALPRTGLGWVFALGLVAVFLSLSNSADPRQGLWRAAWLAGLVLLFYVLAEGFASGWLARKAALAALLAVSGLVVFLALLETYAWYLRWFAAVGNGAWPPYAYRFGSIFGYSNVLMSLANLAAPLALLVFLKARRRAARVGAAAWLLFYLAAVPFSSSRGGWIGLAGWIGALALIWLLEARPWRWVLRWRRAYQVGLAAGLLAGLAGGLALGLRFFLAFAAHPSHGGDPFGGRSYLWAYALDLWRRSPLLGIGPGRYTLEHPIVNPNVPPLFWSYNAHGMPVEVLAEFGLLGAAVLVVALVVGAWQLWRRWLAARRNPQHAPWTAALLAGMAGWLCQMVVDDFTSWISIMVPLVLMAAWVLSLEPAPGPNRQARGLPESLAAAVKTGSPRLAALKGLSLGIAALALLAYSAWDLWGYVPMGRGLESARNGDWPAAAAEMAASAARDPGLNFYAVEAGLAEAQAWGQAADPAALARARDWLRRGLEREPQLSPLRANLAALDWQAGETNMALEGMRAAAAQSPQEPSYPLNLGYYLEQMGQESESLAAYRAALELAPGWRGHPFWQQTPLRVRALAGWAAPAAQASGLDEAAFEQALRAGDLSLARALLARAGLSQDVSSYQGRLREASGDLDGAVAAYRAARDLLGLPLLRRVSNFSFAYTHWAYNRPGLMVDRVPGYLNLEGDAQLYAALERLHALEVGRGECAEAARTWQIWQSALRGFAPVELPPAPACE